jgi:DNA-directed RNA polymerase subunit RPC12/RpoP
MMKKRFKFKCWQCEKNYTLQREISDEQTLFVACPYCNEEAIADLAPYRKKKKTVMKTENNSDQESGYEYQFPDILPTSKLE